MCAGVSQVPGEAVCGRGLAVVLSCVDRGCDGVCASLVDCLGCVGGFFEVGQVGRMSRSVRAMARACRLCARTAGESSAHPRVGGEDGWAVLGRGMRGWRARRPRPGTRGWSAGCGSPRHSQPTRPERRSRTRQGWCSCSLSIQLGDGAHPRVGGEGILQESDPDRP